MQENNTPLQTWDYYILYTHCLFKGYMHSLKKNTQWPSFFVVESCAYIHLPWSPTPNEAACRRWTVSLEMHCSCWTRRCAVHVNMSDKGEYIHQQKRLFSGCSISFFHGLTWFNHIFCPVDARGSRSWNCSNSTTLPLVLHVSDGNERPETKLPDMKIYRISLNIVLFGKNRGVGFVYHLPSFTYCYLY